MSSEQKLDLNQLRVDVEHEIENEAHGKIAKICRTALTSKPNQLFWLRLLCCAMLHLSQTTSLLKLIATYSSNHRIQNALLFYKLYCLYSLKQNQEAMQLLKKHDISRIQSQEERVAIKYLEYQIYYRLGKYDLAFKVLSQITDDEHAAECAVNEISTLIAMDRASDAIDKYYAHTQYASLHNHCDFVFNLATALILCARTDEAKSLLLASVDKCTARMREEDGYEESEIASEIANLELLTAYCLFAEGDRSAAQVYYKRLNDTQPMNGVYEGLILANNCLAVEYNDDNNNKTDIDSASANVLLFKKLLSRKNDDNFSRFGASSMELMKAYHNKCMILIQNPSQPQKRNDSEFKQTVAKMGKHSEFALYVKVSYHLRMAQYQQICDILAHYLSMDYQIKYHLLWIQILIDIKKYRMAIKQIDALKDDEVKYSEKSIGIVLDLCDLLKDKQLKIKYMKECVQYLDSVDANSSLLIALEMDMCQLLRALKQREEAKEIALRLYKKDARNEVYQAMVLLSALDTKDVELANTVSSEMKLDGCEYDAYAVDELLVEIPNIDEENEANEFEFEIAPHIELQRKRAANRKKRQRNAMKLRAKYKENPELYREAVNWESKSKKMKNEKKTRKKKENKNKKSEKQNKNKNKSGGKKKKGFRGAQGGSGQSNRFQVYDIGDPKNKKSGKTVIPQHIKKKRKRG